jgi:hypothetical protein
MSQEKAHNNGETLHHHVLIFVGTRDTVSGFEFRRGLGIFLFDTASRADLGPTPPINWVSGALSLGAKRPGHEFVQSPLSSSEVKE